MKLPSLALVVLLAFGSPISAAVERLEILAVEPVADGRSYGLVGSYEKVTGRLHFALDPASSPVIDLDRAPRDGDGLVRFAADFYLLRPSRRGSGNGSLLLEVSNRGGKAVVRYFDRFAQRSLDPSSEEAIGDGFLLRRGFSVAWVGWQFDVPDDPLRLSIDTVAASEGTPVTGWVRADHVFEDESELFPLGHVGHRAYLPTSPDDERHRLTVRNERLGPREVLPRESWSFRYPSSDSSVGLAVRLEGGFQKGRIYELVYASSDPVVVGIGLAALRDAAAWLRDAEESPVEVERTIGMGISQTGRLLRHFLYQGFNRLADGTKAFDGVIAHTAGAGRGSFNHRFAQPSRDAHRFRAFLYPTDIFPFSGLAQLDPETGRREGLFDRLRGTPAMPKVFLTNTGYEYWGRNAALIHTSIDGERDLELAEEVRSYHFASTQHFVGRFPPERVNTRHRGNPVDFFWSLRALLIAMHRWIADEHEPPPSRLPRLADGTLVALEDYAFPSIPGAPSPKIAHGTYRLDFGPLFESEGIVDHQPPRVGASFPILVPQVDEDGNEIAGIRLPQVAVPLATYTSWNFRSEEIGASHELANFRGSFLPFSVTRRQREARLDPRPSIEERYGGRYEYLGRYAKAAMGLAEEGYLLTEDLPGILRQAEQFWNLAREEEAEIQAVGE